MPGLFRPGIFSVSRFTSYRHFIMVKKDFITSIVLIVFSISVVISSYAFNKALNQSPNDLLTYFSLACVYSLAGSDEDAQAAVERVLKINPNFSVKYWEKRFTYKNIISRASSKLLPIANYPFQGIKPIL